MPKSRFLKENPDFRLVGRFSCDRHAQIMAGRLREKGYPVCWNQDDDGTESLLFVGFFDGGAAFDGDGFEPTKMGMTVSNLYISEIEAVLERVTRKQRIPEFLNMVRENEATNCG